MSSLLLALLLSSPLSAHVLLDDPARRYDDMKGAPCGKGGGEDGRTEHVTALAAGARIEVRWTETINHVGSFRIAFDEDGADAADFDAHVLHAETDPDNPSGQSWATEVTLPDVSCGNCTLQLLQIMTTDPNPSESETYFQCADLVLGDAQSAPPEVTGCHSAGGAPALWLALLGLAARPRRPFSGRQEKRPIATDQ